VILRSIPRKQRMASYRGRLMIDTVRGVLRVRKWPKKRGTPRSALQRFWIDWFTQANLLAKYADPMSQVRAIEMTKGTGLYPRDVLLSAMRGRLYWWADETGWKWFPMAATQDVSNSLDTLSQVIGSVLVRAVDRWRSVVGGVAGQVLTYQGDAAPPTWESAAGGVTQQQLAESPISPDNTVSQYILDVSTYLDVDITFDDVDIASSDTIKFTLSTDGGSTYHTGGTDYFSAFLSATAEAFGSGAQADLSDGSGTSNHLIRLAITKILAPRCSWSALAAKAGPSTSQRTGFARFDGPVTHIKLFTPGANNFNNGSIRAMGSRAA